jgi:CxxC-x17-CxxC domain-containing protein
MDKFKKPRKFGGPGFDKFKKSGPGGPKKFGSRDRNPRDSRDFGGGGAGGFRDKGFKRPGRDFDQEMYEVTCDGCGKKTEVPFRPTGKKPVYCRDCFEQNDGGSADRSGDGYKSRGRSAPRDRVAPRGAAGAGADTHVAAQLAEINDKLDTIIKFLKIN